MSTETYFKIENGMLTRYEGFGGDVVVPDGVTSIGSGAFQGHEDVVAVVIPNSVTSIRGRAFAKCSNLVSVKISDSAISIGGSAFYQCVSLTSIEIPDSVTSIGIDAFSGCSNLASVVIHDGVISIGSSTFDRCEQLTIYAPADSYAAEYAKLNNISFATKAEKITSTTTEIEKTDTIGPIKSATLKMNTQTNDLAEINTSTDQCKIENGVLIEYVGPGGDVVIPEGVTSIKGGAFSGCKNLTSIKTPNALTTIGGNAFSGCENLTSISISESVASIGNCAFQGCKKLTSITIPKSVTLIGDSAFNGCSMLTIHAPSGSYAEKYAKQHNIPFSAKSSIITNTPTEIKKPNNHTQDTTTSSKTNATTTDLSKIKGSTNQFKIENGVLIKYVGSGGDVVIPEGVTSIKGSAFSGCKNLTSIKTPNALTTIGGNAFSGCKNLTSISISESVASIGKCAFSGCHRLTIYAPAGSYVTEYAKKYNIPIFEESTQTTNTPTEIKKQNNHTPGTTTSSKTNAPTTDLSKIKGSTNQFKIENGVLIKYVGSGGDVVIPEGVTSIKGSAFIGCKNLTSIKTPNALTTIGGNAFGGCENLTSISISESVTSIGNSAFSGCKNLISITVPEGITSIGKSVFSGCSSLTSIVLPESVTSIGGCAFNGCKNLTSIKTPNALTTIGGNAFSGCENLTSISISESVALIGNSAFQRCKNLTSITLPESVTYIGDSAFNGCRKLTIHAPANSYALAYAKEHNIPFTEDASKTTGALSSIGTSDNTSLAAYASPKTNTVPNTPAKTNTLESRPTEIKKPNNHTQDSTASRKTNATTITSDEINPSKTHFEIKNGVLTRYVGPGGDVVIPEGVTSIKGGAFSGCKNLTSIKTPNALTTIGGNAFSGCENLTSISISESVASIGNCAFQGCKKLTSITIPKSVTLIGDSAFNGCSMLTIHAPSGSYAEKYAKQNGIPFVAVPQK